MNIYASLLFFVPRDIAVEVQNIKSSKWYEKTIKRLYYILCNI